MKYLSNRNGFLGIDNKFNFKEKVVVIPFGLEKTVSYGGGTNKGPKEIIKASHQVELFDLEADPGCLVDLVDEEFERAKELRAGLIEWLSADRIEGMTVSRSQHSVELLEAIAALGYATESGGAEGPYYEEDPDDEWCKRFK